jgi:hypothetical protein
VLRWHFRRRLRKEYPNRPANSALAKLGTSPLGKGRLWITASRISQAGDSPDNKAGKIEWMKFSVEIILPHRRWNSHPEESEIPITDRENIFTR